MIVSLSIPARFVCAVFFLTACLTALAHARSVKDFGAVGDGRADDTRAIQRAVDEGAGSIDLPPGTYRLTKTVTIDLDRVGWTSIVSDGAARVVMAGGGPAFKFVGTHEGTADPESFQHNVWHRQRMPVVRGIEIIGDHADAVGIEAAGVMQLTVTETLVRECLHAIHLTKRNRNVLISNCHLYHNRGAGVFYDQVNLHQSNIVGCHISYNAAGGIVVRGGEVRNLHVGTCDLESNMLPDGSPAANILIDSTGGSTDEVAITGCTIQHNNKSPESANIRFLGRGMTNRNDDTPTQEGHLTITGNVMSDVRVNIHLQNARGVTITGNTFWEGFDYDLLIEESQVVVVGANDFDRNPRYVVNGNWGKDRGGIALRHCADCKLNGFIVKGVWEQLASISLTDCDRCTLHDLSVLDCDGIGILLKDCRRCRVTDCLVRDDRPQETRRGGVPIEISGGSENLQR